MQCASNAIRFIRNFHYWRSLGYGWKTSWNQAKRTL